MGLDMFLTGSMYIADQGIAEEIKQVVSKLDKNIQGSVSSITTELGYWRKANCIHNWFVNNVQNGVDDCGEYRVDLFKLQALRDLCNSVLKDTSQAQALLPTTEGCFFGSQLYDQFYYEVLEHTIKIVNQAEAWANNSKNFIYFTYYSSW